jgi:CheY-like chemotaxis protein/nitrogen-specific signal transduction histidine kinase
VIDRITELEAELARERELRVEAERLNQLKDRFLAAVSHELRAPLTTLLLWECVLREQSSTPELRAQALEAIHHSALAQSRLVGDLLDVSRAISGKLYVDLRRCDIAALLADAVADVRLAAESKAIGLSYQTDAHFVEVDGDAGRLRQVFDNLLSNAIKFTPAGGRVEVSLRLAEASLEISIADTGMGISPELLPRLFQPFSQADDPLTRATGGLGLGLTIARELVTLHRGTLVANSPGIGRGAVFALTLPTTRARRHATTPPVGIRTAMLTGVRLLVIDDDPRVRQALALLLARAGATITLAEDTVAARRQLASIPPDVIICDIAMPHEDGYSLMRELRAAGCTLPAIALTAHASSRDAEAARVAGFDVHIAKPVNFEKLVRTIYDLIASSAHDREP